MEEEKSKTPEKLEEKISRSEIELQRLLDWVQASESRIALVLPLSTAMVGAIAVLAPSATKWTVLGAVFTSIAIILLLLSIAFSALSAFPRTSGPKGSLIFFGGITTRDLIQYRDALKSRTSDDYLDDLISQCHRNAQIAERKFSWAQRSMASLFLAALPWLISLSILYTARP